MGIQAIYSDSSIIGNRVSFACPKESDVSYNSDVWGDPVVVDVSNPRPCRPELKAKDSTVINTNGCCIVDNSNQTCVEALEITDKDEGEEFYFMNIRQLRTNQLSQGERRMCYTAPLRKKPLYVMYLLREIAIDIAALIAIVLVGACYEYWVVYGYCSGNSIETLLSDIPYSVNEYVMKREDNYTIKMSKECDTSNLKSNSEKVEWYDTFPYSIITFFNKPIIKTKTTDSISDDDLENKEPSNSKLDPSELFKIPIRGFLLGYFNFVIIAKILLKMVVMQASKNFSEYFTKQDSKLRNFLTGLVFIFLFMGLWGNITDRYVGSLPYMNVSCLFLLGAVMFFALFLGGFVSTIYSFLCFIGYRKGSYEKYKINPKPVSKDKDKDKDEFSELSKQWVSVERVEHFFDCYWLAVNLFRVKKNLVSDEETELLSDINENQIKNEEILSWFYPIRRSDLVIKWGIADSIMNFLQILNPSIFWECEQDGVKMRRDMRDMLYWYLQTMSNDKWALISLFSTLKPQCSDVNDVNAGAKKFWENPLWTICRYTFWLAWVFLIRSCIVWAKAALFFCLMFIRPFINVLWIILICIIVMYSLMFSVFGSMFAYFFMFFYILIGFFYVPAKNYSKLLQIIKNHGNMLTILFCIVIVIHGVKVLHPTSAGVVGGLLAIIIIYKLITTFSV